MSLSLRVVLIIFSLLTAFFVFRKIRKSQMQIADTLYWIFFIGFLILLSVFPQIANYACKWVGVASPVNFVFLAIIFLLLLKVFILSVKLSSVDNKLQSFVQEYALDQTQKRNNNDNISPDRHDH